MTRDRITKHEKKERGLGYENDCDRQVHIPHQKLRRGSLKNKIMVPLSDGKTILFLRTDAKIPRIKARYEKYLSSLR